MSRGNPGAPCAAGLLLGVLFVASNLWALHDPQPHGVKVAVGPPMSPMPVVPPDGFEFLVVDSPRDAVLRREAFIGEGVYASANGQVVRKSLGVLGEDVA